ncbi:sensor domain-containing protein [Mycobacterium sp. pUA109]|uniref:sensor domain-containing protein n=1 Tax=Mycobacterium sp. pUA109 TaxID=3238982 RepID=UPI00351AE724
MRLRCGLPALGVLLCTAGCQTVVDGTAQPADRLGPLPSVVVTTTTPSSSLQDKLLGQPEIAGIVGEAAMTQSMAITEPVNDTSTVDPSECAPLALPAQDTVYSSWMQITGNLSKGDGKHNVAQVVSLYKNDSKWSVSYALHVWKDCAQPFTVKQDDGASQVVPDPVTGDETNATRISASMHSQANPNRVCQHVMAGKGNYMVETEVCGNDGQTARQTDEITDRILAKIPD